MLNSNLVCCTASIKAFLFCSETPYVDLLGLSLAACGFCRNKGVDIRGQHLQKCTSNTTDVCPNLEHRAYRIWDLKSQGVELRNVFFQKNCYCNFSIIRMFMSLLLGHPAARA